MSLNFHRFLNKNSVSAKIYSFVDERAARLRESELIESFPGLDKVSPQDLVIISSETALNHLEEDGKQTHKAHYYLREKVNIPEISKKMGIREIPILGLEQLKDNFPLIGKPRHSGKGVPFKFRVFHDANQLDEINEYMNACIFQPYLDPRDFDQIAVAGYYMNDIRSLIVVEQRNQYPIGISSHIRMLNNYDWLKEKVAAYLSEINFIGFVEFEFKVRRNDNQAYLIDVNPRLWGWSYFYFSGIQNIHAVLFENAVPKLNLKKEWINTPRLILSATKGRISLPKSLSISFEPIL